MDDTDKIKEYIFQAVQAGKSETSGLVGSIKSNIAVLQANHEEVVRILERVEAQTIRTNGRVSSLERSRAQLWGSIGAVLFMGGTIIYLSVQAIDSKIKSGIAQALENYDKTTTP